MARENPLFAVMTTEEMQAAPAEGFSPELLDALFEKGRRLFGRHLTGVADHSPDPVGQGLTVEYGCGVGRMLKAAIEQGHRCAGIDISPTMLEHCRRLVPEAEGLYVLDDQGRSALPDGAASVVFSYAVVQHIASLKDYLTAFDEMCRILKPDGVLAVHLNCADFEGREFSDPARTENFEDHSLHFRPGESEPYQHHDQNQWSGVYIGARLLTDFLAERGVWVTGARRHGASKSLAIWVQGRKRSPAWWARREEESFSRYWWMRPRS